MDPVPEAHNNATKTPEAVRPGSIVFESSDILQLTAAFSYLRTELYRNRLLDAEQEMLNNIRDMLSRENLKDTSTSSVPGVPNLLVMEKYVNCLQQASFSNRSVAAQEAAVTFDKLKKNRPMDKSYSERRMKPPKKETLNRRERETLDKRPERNVIKEKPSTSKSVPNEPQPIETDETQEQSLAVNRGKRRVAAAPPPPVPEKQPDNKKAKKENGTTPAAKKRTSNRLSKTPRVNTKEIDEPTYCFCNRVSFGEMIGCDNEKCEIEWFHFECIGLSNKPKGKWYCPNCRHPESARMLKSTSKKDSRSDKRGDGD